MALVTQTFFMLLAFSTTLIPLSTQQEEIQLLPVLAAEEQEAVYRVLELINGNVPWRVIFPDDFCVSSPHGVVCDYFVNPNSTSTQPDSAHITELNLGYVSDYNSNPPCASNATLPFWIFSSLPRLRKLFVFNCFVGVNNVSFPEVSVSSGTEFELEELVLIDNPALTGSLTGIVRCFMKLKKLVVTGSGFYGNIPYEVGGLVGLEQMSLSGNRLNGVVPDSLTNLTNLKVLDLSRNQFEGAVPDSIGGLKALLKLDLSFNNFSGRIPYGMSELLELEFMDLSYNGFVGNGIPVCLKGMVKLKEVYLNGNGLGGQIPDIWENHGGLLGLGLSGLGLTGVIPKSMVVSLKSLSYLGLENNSLEGMLPDELLGLESLKEINVENNKLSGAVRLEANVTSLKRLKLAGNSGLCIDRSLDTDADAYRLKHGMRYCASEMPLSANLSHHTSSAAALASLYLLVAFLGCVLSICL